MMDAEKYPYNVMMFRDGTIFEVEDAGENIFDPIVGEGSEGPGFSGTFWAYSKEEAIILAENFRVQAIADGIL